MTVLLPSSKIAFRLAHKAHWSSVVVSINDLKNHRQHFSSSPVIANHQNPKLGDDATSLPTLHPAIAKPRSASTSDHLHLDRTHLWHPYTSLVDPSPVLPVERAHGCTLHLEDGSELLDGMSSWWAAVWGYNHPALNQALQRQLQNMSHVMFGGLTHRPATELASSLLHMLQGTQLNQIFYSDSGSVAVEVALKMALQYQRGVQLDFPNRKTRLVSVRGGYHGDTLGAMSVCDPVNGMHSAFPMLPEHAVVFVPRPPCDGNFRVGSFQSGCRECSCQGDKEEEALDTALRELERTIQEQHETLAAMILEPIVQGAGGMRFYSQRYLQRARQLCDEFDMLLICDEIATGFGRSSSSIITTATSSGEETRTSLFASLEAGVEPDILCLGKALTGGYMTLGAVVTSEKVSRGVSSTPAAATKDASEAAPPLPLMHGPTFMGNPLACSVAVASTNLLLQEEGARSTTEASTAMNRKASSSSQTTPMWKAQVARIEEQLRTNLEEAAALDTVADVRVRGAIGVIELEEPVDNNRIPQRCRELGVWLRPFGKLLYTMPPFVMSNEELQRVTDAMVTLARENGS